MNYLIFSTLTDANTRQQEITDACHFTDGVTVKYADIITHPTQSLYALIVHPLYLQYFTQEEINGAVELTDDWFPAPSMPS